MRHLSGLAGALLVSSAISSGARIVRNPEAPPKEPELPLQPEPERTIPPPDENPHAILGRGDKLTIKQAMEKTGTQTPRQALDKLNEGKAGRKYIYMPHRGAKQKAKAEKRRIATLKKSVGL